MRNRRAAVRRVALAIAAATAATLTGLAPPADAGPVLAIRFQGQVASAVWSTCPADPAPGQRCEETVVMAFDARTQETTDQPSGPHFLGDRDDVVVLQRFWMEARLVDGELTMVSLKESFGRTTTAAVDIPQRLTSATVDSGPISMHTTDYVAETETTETDSVTASWTPAGALTPISEWSRASARWGLQVESTKGWTRLASATATIDGAPVAGDLQAADLFSVTQRSQLVLRGRNAEELG